MHFHFNWRGALTKTVVHTNAHSHTDRFTHTHTRTLFTDWPTCPHAQAKENLQGVAVFRLTHIQTLH